MPPYITSTSIAVTTEDIQAAVDAYLAANPLDLTDHLAAPDPHTGYQKESEKGNPNGYAGLNASGVIPDYQIGTAIARDTEIATQLNAHIVASDPHGDRGVASAALAAHAADTTSIHGIADTSVLATTTDVSDAVSTHATDTTSVHGIVDTATLVINTSNKLWPQKVTVTANQTEPAGAVDGDFWIAPAT